MKKKLYNLYSCKFCGKNNIKLWGAPDLLKDIIFSRKIYWESEIPICFSCIKISSLLKNFVIRRYAFPKHLYKFEDFSNKNYKIKLKIVQTLEFQYKEKIVVNSTSDTKISFAFYLCIYPFIPNKLVMKNNLLYYKKKYFWSNKEAIKLWYNLKEY